VVIAIKTRNENIRDDICSPVDIVFFCLNKRLGGYFGITINSISSCFDDEDSYGKIILEVMALLFNKIQQWKKRIMTIYRYLLKRWRILARINIKVLKKSEPHRVQTQIYTPIVQVKLTRS
jgi:hypothetical protein